MGSWRAASTAGASWRCAWTVSAGRPWSRPSLASSSAPRPSVRALAEAGRHAWQAHSSRLVLVATAIIAGIWWWHRPDMAFEIALAVLVATCPCALSLATPTGLVAATSAMARRGLLVACTDALEVLVRVDRVVLDKTGTLTTGEPTIRGVDTNGGLSRERALALAAALEAHSEHPSRPGLRHRYNAVGSGGGLRGGGGRRDRGNRRASLSAGTGGLGPGDGGLGCARRRGTRR
ncbi:MAG: HAD family hydrolase [Arhodomonas sp.]|nr:HAD family hydrolase [Arhodomonas sp.]